MYHVVVIQKSKLIKEIECSDKESANRQCFIEAFTLVNKRDETEKYEIYPLTDNEYKEFMKNIIV